VRFLPSWLALQQAVSREKRCLLVPILRTVWRSRPLANGRDARTNRRPDCTQEMSFYRPLIETHELRLWVRETSTTG
jgi:hypothetical protein